MPRPRKSHDLHLPTWGPYSKRYAGISHIPDLSKGLRFDLGIIPGHYRRQMLIPNEKWASGHHAWEAAPDLSYYAYRYELEWKDQVFCDVSFSEISQRSRLIRCEFVNNTGNAQSLMLHLVAYINFPPVRPYSDEPICMTNVSIPAGGIWVDALDYEELQFAKSRPTDSLVADGMLRAEIRANGFVDGSGIGEGFGSDPGDWVLFRYELEKPLINAVINFRYRLDAGGVACFKMDGTVNREVVFTEEHRDADGFCRLALPVSALNQGQHNLRLVSLGGTAIELDGFAITGDDQADQIRFTSHAWTPAPEILPGPHSNSLILRYADTKTVYGIAWSHPDFWIRQYLHDELDILLRYLVPNNYSEVVHGSGEGHFTDIFMRPIFLSPHAVSTVYGFVCAGALNDVQEALAEFVRQDHPRHEDQYRFARQKAASLTCLPAGEPFRFSQQRMAATELMNVVYPVYSRRQFIRHNTPGKWWDCLYTWDSGFIGLALLELDLQRACDCLNAYLTEPGDTHAAFVHHGSPVPVQMYLFHEIWNRTQDKEFLGEVYPSLRQYYLFLVGRLGSSTTRRLKSNLLITWEYFFESGGWDDYPAQMHVLADFLDEGNMQERGIQVRTACAAITAHAVRSARILNAAAEALGIMTDQAIYEEDIEIFSDALQRYSWDDKAGFFSYVLHDKEGNPAGKLFHESGVNFNMGLDGIMPLLAGICTPEQQSILLDRLADPDRFWTPIGLSTVDQSAPYYRKDGYWNGAVWFPHQWFMWKTALDLGQGDFAYQIARTALDLWKREVEISYYCFEHFIIESGRGAGWHQFGGLSSPVVSWFSAYHLPGRLATGFDIWVEEQEFTSDFSSFTGRLRLSNQPRTVTVIVNLQPGCAYSILWNGEPVLYSEINPGSFQIQLPFKAQVGQLDLVKVMPNQNGSEIS